jgi:hypothetical protein
MKGLPRRNDKVIVPGYPRENPKGTSDRACVLPYFLGEALRVT